MDFSQCLFLIVVVCLATIDALMFHLNPNERKCLKEEIHKDKLVTGDFALSEAPGQKAFLKVSGKISGCQATLWPCSPTTHKLDPLVGEEFSLASNETDCSIWHRSLHKECVLNPAPADTQLSHKPSPNPLFAGTECERKVIVWLVHNGNRSRSTRK